MPARLEGLLHGVTGELALHGDEVLRRPAAREPGEPLDIFRQTLLSEREPHLRRFLNAASQDRAGVGNGLEIIERASGQLLSLRQAGQVGELLRYTNGL